MYQATETFIKENLKLINNNNWKEIHKILKAKSESIVSIDFVKLMLECGINPGLPQSLENYTYENMATFDEVDMGR